MALIAHLELARRRPLEHSPGELLAAAQAGPDAPPGRSTAPETFDDFWAAFDQLDPSECRRHGRRIIAANATSMTVLSRRLAEADPCDRVRAVRIVTLLEISAEFAEQLYQLSHDPDPEVRSAALNALSQIPGAASRRILHNALGDEDARVQANAIEAIEKTGDIEATTDLMAKLASTDNRVRANAVKALLRLGVREAAEALLQMLHDENRAQRISALWLVDHLNLATLANRIMTIARADDDPQIRERARALAERLLRAGVMTNTPAGTRTEVAPSTR